jgi:hypothetical protein
MNLCGYSKYIHKPWGEYIARKELEQKEKDNIFFNVSKSEESTSDEYAENDFSWLNGM